MVRLALLLLVTLAACGVRVDPPPLSAAKVAAAKAVRPDTRPDLRGRWTISAVNGRATPGLWLELGSEGRATITRKGNAIYVASPQPRTRAFLGCNSWDPSGWTRNGDTLTLGVEMSGRTERGCDTVTEVVDEEAYAILHDPMTMELASPNRLRLTNENGALELIRYAAQAE